MLATVANHLRTLNDARRFWVRVSLTCLILSVAALPFAVTGCGGGEDTEENGASEEESMLEQKAEADDAKSKAQAANAELLAQKKWERAVNSYEGGEDRENDGKFKLARTKYKQAARNFKDALDDAEKNKGSLGAIQAMQAEYEKLKKEAEAIEANKLAASNFDWAEKEAKAGAKYIADVKLKTASKSFESAMRIMKEAIETAKSQAVVKAEITALIADVSAAKESAMAAKAEELAQTDMDYAKDQERQGQTAFENYQFSNARNLFQNARDQFRRAEQYAKRTEIVAANASSSDETGLDGNNSSSQAPKLEDIPIPGAGAGNDRIDLSADLYSLFHCSPEYDGKILTLNYATGTQLKDDLEIIRGIVGTHIRFAGAEGVGQAITDYTLAGNTDGMVLINAGFHDGVSIEFDLQVQLCVAGAFFRIMTMVTDGGESFYGSNFGTNIELWESKRAPKISPAGLKEYRGAPQNWTSKRELRHVKVKYKKDNEEEKGLLEVWYDDQLCGQAKIDKYRRGRLGFWWHDVKFFIQDLKISGYLDEDWARERLQMKQQEARSGKPEGDFGEDF